MSAVEKGGAACLPEKATVKKVAPLTDTDRLFTLTLDSGRSLGHAPGQFVVVSLSGIGEGPVSIASPPAEDNSLELVVSAADDRAGAMHHLAAGNAVGIGGPFGNGFPIKTLMGMDLLLVAGGVGLAPLRSLIKYSLQRRDIFGRIIVLFGARLPQERLFTDELAQWSSRTDVELLETVERGDEGWKGNVGVITALFKKVSIDPRRTAVLMVGPPIMYKYALLEARGKEVPKKNIWLSLEHRMKCGLGACGHCRINKHSVCRDGPIFAITQIEAGAVAL